ncbi:MAG: carbamoyltransferase HypF [Acidobacteria bacterium]|nr:carbamoyltransferase HypF [Acidobacteriota bacterium]
MALRVVLAPLPVAPLRSEFHTVDLPFENSTRAATIRLRGIVQGVGMRPWIYRLAIEHGLGGWVRNGVDGVEIFVEGPALEAFVADLRASPPPAAFLSAIEVEFAATQGCPTFEIRESGAGASPTTRVSPDLATCDDCARELFDPADPRFLYPYINCTNCGPRYSIVLGLPYDRCRTTMAAWPMDALCNDQYGDPRDRRFHAQPVACPQCGPQYTLQPGSDEDPIAATARLLNDGAIVAIKSIGGYHLACDARNAATVLALRERKFRKEKPFALMARDPATARALVDLTPGAEELLQSVARPIVIAPARQTLEHVAPGNNELGVMLPYTPLHLLLFHYGAPAVLVLTSANRSDEPIAYTDDEALRQLSAIADAFLIGQRPIARRVDDSLVRSGDAGPMILRRARGYAPGAVAALPTKRPILALGADLKNTITLCVDGQAFTSQHIGDLEHYPAHEAFLATVRDLLEMYRVPAHELRVAHDLHPDYFSTREAARIPHCDSVPVQHHRAHIASVLAERQSWETRVIGVSCDGTGYGDDGSIWGCEYFAGSLEQGFQHLAGLLPAMLPGGDAAARFPVQAAAGFLSQLDAVPSMTGAPFHFPIRYEAARALVNRKVRVFPTTSMGRLFDTVAAIAGFTGECSFEGQAAIWLEQLARAAGAAEPYPFPEIDGRLDYRPMLEAALRDAQKGKDRRAIALAFHLGAALGISRLGARLCETEGTRIVVLSGGVFQNQVLLNAIHGHLKAMKLDVWVNRIVPPNDGGISLGQAALAAFV